VLSLKAPSLKKLSIVIPVVLLPLASGSATGR
jgi:hypothetical protein